MATSKPPKPPGQYDVGYGKPPAKGQFKPGQSGNPGGRRKGQPTPQETVVKEGARLVKIKRGDTVEIDHQARGDHPQTVPVSDGRRHRGGAIASLLARAGRA